MRGFDVLVVCGPLDLGDVEGKILSEIKREIRLYAGGGDEWMDLYEEFEGLNNTFRILEIAVNVFKQRLESACGFYLRYKNNPELLVKERPGEHLCLRELCLFYIDKRCSLDYTLCRFPACVYFSHENIDKDEYNEWLFKLAFRDVLGDDEK